MTFHVYASSLEVLEVPYAKETAVFLAFWLLLKAEQRKKHKLHILYQEFHWNQKPGISSILINNYYHMWICLPKNHYLHGLRPIWAKLDHRPGFPEGFQIVSSIDMESLSINYNGAKVNLLVFAFCNRWIVIINNFGKHHYIKCWGPCWWV